MIVILASFVEKKIIKDVDITPYKEYIHNLDVVSSYGEEKHD